jgi:hypothetical protein
MMSLQRRSAIPTHPWSTSRASGDYDDIGPSGVVKDKLVVDTFDLRGKNELSDTDYRYFD